MMKRIPPQDLIMRLLIFTLVVAFIVPACVPLCPAAGSESCDPQLPSITSDTGWWVDMTGQVSPTTLQALQEESIAIERDGFQLAGVIVANAASDPSQIASDFGNKNGIGSAAKDNGVAVVVFFDKAGNDGNKPYIFMAPGSGLSGLTATKLGQIRDKFFVPARANGQWEAGLVATVKAIHQELLNPGMQVYSTNTPSSSGGDGLPTWAVIVLVLFFLFIFVVVVAGGGLNSSGTGGDSDGGGTFGGGGGGTISLGGGGGFSGSGAGG